MAKRSLGQEPRAERARAPRALMPRGMGLGVTPLRKNFVDWAYINKREGRTGKIIFMAGGVGMRMQLRRLYFKLHEKFLRHLA